MSNVDLLAMLAQAELRARDSDVVTWRTRGALTEGASSNSASILTALWRQTRRLCCMMAMRFMPIAEANGAIDKEDLEQTAYVAFHRAVKAYKPEEGAFTTILGYYVQTECQALLGHRGRERKEHYMSIPWDSPVSREEGIDMAVGDMVEDDGLPGMTDALELADLQREVQEAIDRLPDMQREVIRECCLDDVPLKDFGERHGITKQRVFQLKQKAFQALMRNPRIRAYEPDYYWHKGVTAFKSSWTSVVEDIAIRIIEHQEAADLPVESHGIGEHGEPPPSDE